MSTGTAAFDRIVSFVIGLLLVAFSVWAIGYHFNWAPTQQVADWFNPGQIASIPDQSWYPWALGGICVALALLGIWLIGANLFRRSFNRVSSGLTDESGKVTLAVQPIASALSEELGELPHVTRARSTVAMDRKRPTVRFDVNADAAADVSALRQSLELAERDFRAAVEDADVDTTYVLNLGPVDR